MGGRGRRRATALDLAYGVLVGPADEPRFRELGNVPTDDANASAAKARECLEKCVATGVTTYYEYRAAQAELARIRKSGAPATREGEMPTK